MAILTAEVEANGWVLGLTLMGGLTVPNTDFGQYQLEPNGTPRVRLACSHGGFVRDGGVAVAGTLVRDIVATVPLRLPVSLTSPTVKVLDEVDLGGGQVRVRLALAETVYASDAGLSLAVSAEWRAGEGAAAGIAVVNSSARVAPVPIMRWVLAPYEAVAGSFRLSLIVASHHPVGFEPVAGVKFTATDGVATRTVWATALATDDSHGDGLRCYSVLLDPAGLGAGLLRCDAEVYPWLGVMRSTDPAGTRDMAGLRTAGFGSGAASPFVVGHDPAGTRYSNMVAFVDPVAGTTTAAAAMVVGNLAAAKAIAPGARPRDVVTAVQAAKLRLRALPAANGQAAATQSVDGLRVVLAAGVHLGLGAAAGVTTGITCTEIPVCIEGDPDLADPRGSCVVQTATAAANLRVPRLRWRNLTVETGGTALNATLTYMFVDGIEVRGKAGQEAVATIPLVTGTTPAGQWAWCATGSRFWRTGWSPGGANRQVGLFRANQNARFVAGICVVRNRWIPPAEDGFTNNNPGTPQGYGNHSTTTDLGALEDVFFAYNDVRRVRFASWRPVAAPAALAGTLHNSSRRQVLLCNVMERVSDSGNTSDVQFTYGESSSATMSYNIIEGNTSAGAGYNCWYSDPVPVTVADTDSQYNEAFCNRHANNAVDRNASKQDDFNDGTVLAVRTAGGVPNPTGYRPQMVFAWGPHFGVDMEGHVDCARAGTIANFRREFAGIRGTQFAVATLPGWTDDACEKGSNLGGGNYVPVAGSVLLGRAVRGNGDRDFAGNPRVVGGAAGAFEAPAGGPLAAAGGRSLQLAGGAVVGLALAVAPAGGVLAQRGGASLVGWAAGLVAGNGVIGQAAGAAVVSIGEASAGDVLAAFAARHFWAPGEVLLLPDRVAAELPALRVTAEQRVVLVR